MLLLRDPNVAYALVIAGLLVGYIELLRPGWIVPGVCGAVMAMVAIASLIEQGIKATGLMLAAAALALVAAEAKFGLSGVAALAAAAMLTVGARELVREPRIHWWVAVAVSVPFVAITARLLAIAIQARENKLRP